MLIILPCLIFSHAMSVESSKSAVDKNKILKFSSIQVVWLCNRALSMSGLYAVLAVLCTSCFSKYR